MLVKDHGEHVIISRHCPMCGDYRTIAVDAADWTVYNKGMLLQNAFPNLSADDREFIKTGLCPICWDRLMGEA